jgi:uncharacterized BrkB/YihY/UPF0761 family membrane protein
MALGGLAVVGLAIASAVWRVLSVVDHGWPVLLLVAALVLVFFILWFVIPNIARIRTKLPAPTRELRR